MKDAIIIIALVLISAAGFIMSGRTQKKSIGIWDIAFIGAFWNLFDTGWWFQFCWDRQAEPDILGIPYMISALLFAIVFLAYVRRRRIDMGPAYSGNLLVLPKAPSGRKEIKTLSLFVVATVFIVLPIAYGMGFISWTPDLRWGRMPVRLVEYVVFVGFVEELVFRGAIQNLLAGTFSFKYGKGLALFTANLLFAFMWTHASVPALINWDYIIMAFILGLFYAGVYVRSGNIWAAALLHGLVDFLWITFFGG